MRRSAWYILLTIGFVVWAIVPGLFARADDFYKDKKLRLVVMTSPGGGYDTYSRAIARFFGKHIPGKEATEYVQQTLSITPLVKEKLKPIVLR